MSDGQSPTPSMGPEGSDLRTVASQIEGLLGEGTDINDGRPSRAHPDYDETQREQPRGRDGRYTAAQEEEAERQAQQELEQPDDDTAAEDEYEAAGDTDEAAETSAQDEAEDSTEETDGEPIETLEQYAEALEMSVDDLLSQVKHTFRASGEDVTVTLSELVSGYQKDADYRKNTAKLAQERRAIEAAEAARTQEWQQANHVVASQLRVAEQLLAQEAQDPRMEQLRQSDPAEWTARQQEFQRRFGILQSARQQAMAAYQQQQHDTMTKLKERELGMLQEAVPDFDQQHGKQAWETITSLGYTPDEAKQIFDHRMIVGALELHRLREENAALRAQKDQAEQSVRRVKKKVAPMQKPGKRRTGGGVKRDQLSSLRKRAAKSGSVGDAAKVIEHLMG
jgi:hypothetical protein